jgi:cation transport protein ChaC
VVRRDHFEYAGLLDDAAVIARVHAAAGRRGANRDYVLNTLAHLRELGIRDRHLEAVGAGLAVPAAERAA